MFSGALPYDPLEDTWAGYVERHLGNALCDYSRSVLSARTQDPIDLCRDESTANAVVDGLVAHRTLPSYLWTMTAPQLVLRLANDNVRITDPEVRLEAQVATVIRTTWRQARSTVTLRAQAPALAGGRSWWLPGRRCTWRWPGRAGRAFHSLGRDRPCQ